MSRLRRWFMRRKKDVRRRDTGRPAHRIPGALLVALTSVAVVAGHASARDATLNGGIWYVSPTGSGTSCTEAAPCGSLQSAYMRAAPGDTVFLAWNGPWFTRQRIGPSANKGSAPACSSPSLRSGCVRFTPAPGYAPSITGAVAICADYVELDSIDVAGTLVPDGFGNQITTGGVSVGNGDNSCQPSGGPPHDFVLLDLAISNGGLYTIGSAHDGWVGDSVVGGSLNISNQLGGVGNNGLDPLPVNHVTYADDTFQKMTWTDTNHHHPECLHMDYASDHISLVGDRFLGCRVYSIRVEAEGDPARNADAQTNHVIDHVYADSAPVNFDCHDNNCVLAGITVTNSTLLGGLSLTDDCRLTASHVCTVLADDVSTSTIAGSCPSSLAIYGGGWSESHNDWRDLDRPFPSGTICSSDSTST